MMECRRLGVAIVCLLAVAVLCSVRSLSAAEADIQAGSRVYARGRVDITHDDRVVATVAAGTELYVREVRGDWVYVRVTDKGKTVRGRVRRREVRTHLAYRRPDTDPKEGPEAGPSAEEAAVLAKLDRVPVEFLAIYAEIVPELKAKRIEVTFLVSLKGDLPRSDMRLGDERTGVLLYRPSPRLSDQDTVQIPAPPSKALAAKIRALLSARRVDPERLGAYRNAALLLGGHTDANAKARHDAARLAGPLWQKAYNAVEAAPARRRHVW